SVATFDLKKSLLDLLKTSGAIVVKHAGLGGRDQLLLEAIKESDVEHVLKRLDVLTHAGLGQVQLLRGSCHALSAKDAFKNADVIQIDVINDHWVASGLNERVPRKCKSQICKKDYRKSGGTVEPLLCSGYFTDRSGRSRRPEGQVCICGRVSAYQRG